MAGRKLEGCILEKPTRQSISLGGKYINMSAISRLQDIDLSYLSKIINGQKPMSLNAARKIGAAIGMTIEELIDAIEERNRLRRERDHKIIKQYKHRISKEDKEDEAMLAAGIPPRPRLPVFRLPQDQKN
jgi:plasmid maintenance system antidote protein VapI